HRVRIGVLRRTWRDAEQAVLRIDGAQATVGPGLDPGDVFADRRYFPALESRRRNQHGEVGLATGRRERRGDVALFAGGRLDAEDQHVLGEPALVASHY